MGTFKTHLHIGKKLYYSIQFVQRCTQISSFNEQDITRGRGSEAPFQLKYAILKPIVVNGIIDLYLLQTQI